ncbi:MAG: P1 family peptidase [Caldilineaceae bacterium]|nr:P1 family peptidase [Caldilineaceae bacterium]
MARARLRELGIVIGDLPPGPNNAITDVADVWVGHTTVIQDEPRVARTGVTVVVPRAGEMFTDPCFAAYHSFNGNGEMTGIHWIAESGMLGTPIALTNTHQVGIVRDALVEYECRRHPAREWLLPVVAETYDGFLNDINAFHLTKEHVFAALAAAGPGPLSEGCVGGGTGMICHAFKGGIGTASRVAETKSGPYTVGVLVQANYGERRDLRVNGIPVGRALPHERVPVPWQQRPKDGSIIILLATDAPLLPVQCRRLAQRAAVGLGRVGGMGHNGSGDIFLAFATGNHLSGGDAPVPLRMLPNHTIDPLFRAAVEAVEEAILNAMIAAETMTGQQGRTAYALPLDQLQELMAT